MNSPEDKEREFRLRELETQIEREQRSSKPEVKYVEPSLHATRKHNPPENSIRKFGRKIVKIVKFTGFVVAGIVVIQVGLFVGMWMTYSIMAGIIAGIGYQIFLKEDK